MADKPTGPSVTEEALMFFGAMLILAALWYYAGGPGKADLRGIFLSPPAPLGTGDAYGPQLGNDATTTPKVDAPATFEPNY